MGLKNAGAANMGGSIATAGGLVFIAATTDSKFRAFDSRTGKELWMTRIDATGDAVPMTYRARNGKQYVLIAAAGTNRFRMIANSADETADSLIAFALGRDERGGRAEDAIDGGADEGSGSRTAGGRRQTSRGEDVHELSWDRGVRGHADESRGVGRGGGGDGGKGRCRDCGRDSGGGRVFGEELREVKRQDILDLAQVEGIGCLYGKCGSEMIINIAKGGSV